MIKVKLGVMPGKVREVEVEKGTSVYKVVNELGILDEIIYNYELRVNGVKTPLETALTDDSLVLFIKQVKGN